MNKLFAILPCYNEELNIGELIDKWYAEKDKLKDSGYELVIVGIDDCSTDNTKKIIEDKCKQLNNVYLLPHEVNKGLCGGLNSAIGYFLKNGSKDDLMTLMDGDNTHDPKYVHAMLKKLTDGKKDCVIASRYCDDSSVVGVANHREFMSDMAKIYYSLVLQVPNVKDYTCGYRIYTFGIIEKLVKRYGEEPIVERSFACMMELLYKIYTVGASFDETGFELRYDHKLGQSKMNVLKTMKKSLTTAVRLRAGKDRENRKKYTTSSFIIYSFIVFFTLLLLSATSMFFISNDFGHDAGLFAYIGYAITQGKAMYLEAWDNKGPLLYLINAFGILINYRYGICLIEFITLLVSMIFLYKTAKLFVSKDVAIACAVASMVSLTENLEGGNFSEEYALPFTILGFYLIAKYLKNEFDLKRIEMVIVGCCISAVFLLRMNILAFLGCAVLGVVIILLKHKEYKKLGIVFVYAFTGFLIVLAPVICYLVSTGTLKSCIDTAYLGILGSFNHESLLYRINATNLMSLEMARSGSLFVIICFIFFFILRAIMQKNEKDTFNSLCWISVFGILATFWANSISGAAQRHYFISFVPVLIIPSVALAKYVMKAIDKSSDKKINTDSYQTAAVIFLVFLISLPSMFNYLYYSVMYKNPERWSYPMSVVSYIKENTDDSDLIEVIGSSSAVSSYYGAKRNAASQYFYYANGRFSDESKTMFATKIFEDVTKNHPKLIMFEQGSADKEKDFVDHCQHAEEWNGFLEKYYDIDENCVNYKVYKHK